MLRQLLILASLIALTPPVVAETRLSGMLTATQACPAVQSIRRQSNPGNIVITPGERYELLAANKTPPTHLRIVVPGASPAERWVAVQCGDSPAFADDSPAFAGTGADYILAVNWQPAFCELNARVRECRDQRPNAPDATQFSLHGLWPQPRGNEYCNVSGRDRAASESGRWRDLPVLDLTIAQRRALDLVMPGSQSGLDRHEWIKHGTCFGGDERAYYQASLDLMAALNASEVRALFAANIGSTLQLEDIKAAFERAFGRGAGERVIVDCARDGDRQIIRELRIAIRGDVTTADFAELIRAGERQRDDCRSGVVDRAGLQ
ncbi:ribonuclease T2 family protein [Devosia chinhatensis]|nr:ribonuclease T(2) [Devosia chinhatensis]